MLPLMMTEPGCARLSSRAARFYRVAERGVRHVEIGADRAHDDRPAVDADSCLQWRHIRDPRHGRRFSSKSTLDAEPRSYRAQRMIFMGDRRTEQRQNAIAGELRDRPLVAVDLLDHQVEAGSDDCIDVLGIKPLAQTGRADQIHE